MHSNVEDQIADKVKEKIDEMIGLKDFMSRKNTIKSNITINREREFYKYSNLNENNEDDQGKNDHKIINFDNDNSINSNTYELENKVYDIDDKSNNYFFNTDKLNEFKPQNKIKKGIKRGSTLLPEEAKQDSQNLQRNSYLDSLGKNIKERNSEKNNSNKNNNLDSNNIANINIYNENNNHNEVYQKFNSIGSNQNIINEFTSKSILKSNSIRKKNKKASSIENTIKFSKNKLNPNKNESDNNSSLNEEIKLEYKSSKNVAGGEPEEEPEDNKAKSYRLKFDNSNHDSFEK